MKNLKISISSFNSQPEVEGCTFYVRGRIFDADVIVDDVSTVGIEYVNVVQCRFRIPSKSAVENSQTEWHALFRYMKI